MMEQRKIIQERVEIRFEYENSFNNKITFGNIKKAVGISDDDEVIEITEKSGWGPTWGGDEQYYRYPVIVVNRPRPETDDEYFARLKKQENINKQKEESERLEYLRLKAKFEAS